VLLLSTTTEATGRVYKGWEGKIYLLLRALKKICSKCRKGNSQSVVSDLLLLAIG
jgi:hypothetical protein